MGKIGVGIQLKIVGGKYLKAILCVKKITLNKAGQKGGMTAPGTVWVSCAVCGCSIRGPVICRRSEAHVPSYVLVKPSCEVWNIERTSWSSQASSRSIQQWRWF